MAKLHRFQSGEDLDGDGEPSGKRGPSNLSPSPNPNPIALALALALTLTLALTVTP